MRTGAEYREALRDGRRVWVMGEGWVDDVTVHPATRAMVDEYAAWYDRHFDPEWRDVVLSPPGRRGGRVPWSYLLPRSPGDLRGMGRCFSATTFLSAGNITHTPAYGNLIALGILDAIQQRNVSPEQIAQAAEYRELIARTGRFLTFCAGAATIGARLREDPGERVALHAVRETDAGLVLQGKVGMHTSPAYAEDVYIGGLCGVDLRSAPRDVHRPDRRPGRHRPLPEDLGPPCKPLHRPAEQPLRRAGRADVARRRVRPLGARLPDGPVARGDGLLALLAPALLLAVEGGVHARPGPRLRTRPGLEGARGDDRVPGRSHHRCADRADVPDRRRARPRRDPGGLLHSRARPHRGGQHRHAQGSAAHDRDLAHPPRLVPGRRAIRQGPGGAGDRGRAGGIVQRRRVHRAAACGPAPDGLGPRRLGAGRPRVGLRAARQRGHSRLARRACAGPSAATTSWPTASCAGIERRDAGGSISKASAPFPCRCAGR